MRWLLLGIGVLVVVGVYWVSRRGTSGETSIAQRIPPVPPGEDAAHTEEPPDETPAESSTDDETLAAVPEHAVGGRLLVLHVQAKSPYKFAGADILRIAEQAGLERAAGSGGGFFQRRAPTSAAASEEAPLFYLANMFSPGVFKWADMESFSTTGLSLFAQLPGALTPPAVFDELLECARLFADNLHGAVLDDSHSDLTAQTIQHIKEDLQAYAMGRAAPGVSK